MKVYFRYAALNICIYFIICIISRLKLCCVVFSSGVKFYIYIYCKTRHSCRLYINLFYLKFCLPVLECSFYPLYYEYPFNWEICFNGHIVICPCLFLSPGLFYGSLGKKLTIWVMVFDINYNAQGMPYIPGHRFQILLEAIE